MLGPSQISRINNALVWVLISGVLSGIRVFLIYTAIETEGASIVNAFIRVNPLIVAILAFFFLGEVLSPMQMVGGALILLSALGISRIKANYANG